MSVYMIVDSRVKDREKYKQYIDQVSPIVAKYGGRYRVRGEKIRDPRGLEARENSRYRVPYRGPYPEMADISGI